MINEESGRLLKLSQNTLLLSKMEAMQIVSDKEDYDVAEQIRKCLILMNKSIEEKDIEVDMDEDLKLPINGNREMLEHVWLNLLSNAVKFTPDGGSIKIAGGIVENTNPETTGVENSRRILEVRITDSGIGMDEETMSKIFDKYYQNDPVSITKGSGIGLAIVKRIVTLSGGHISVSSWPGSGTTFAVRLPVTD